MPSRLRSEISKKAFFRGKQSWAPPPSIVHIRSVSKSPPPHTRHSPSFRLLSPTPFNYGSSYTPTYIMVRPAPFMKNTGWRLGLQFADVRASVRQEIILFTFIFIPFRNGVCMLSLIFYRCFYIPAQLLIGFTLSDFLDQAAVTGVSPSSPPVRAFIFIAHTSRVQHSFPLFSSLCSSIFILFC